MNAILVSADISPEQLSRYAKLIYDKVGITISQQKITLLSNRLRRRLRATGIASYEEYWLRLKNAKANDPEWDAFLQEVTTHETFLFRDPTHWNWLRETYLPQLITAGKAGVRGKSLRILSAACSTGDEATSIACCVADRLPSMKDWQIKILGTDVGVAAVAQAQKGEFGERAMRLVPDDFRRRFFEKVDGSSNFASKPILRDMLQFRIHNLMEPLREQSFDLIFLKNVLIYFDAASKKTVLTHIRRVLRPGGYLITGAAEGVADLVKDIQTTAGWLHLQPPSGR